MASIIVDLSDDIKKLQSLKAEIQEVKKELGSINVNVHLDIKRDMEAKLKSLTSQYDALVKKVSEAEGKVIASTQRINQAAEKIIKAQEQLAKVTGAQPQTGNASSGANAAAANAETASVQAQAKAYDELADEIDAVMGTRTQNIRRMIEEQNAIRIINEELKRMQKLNQSGMYSKSEIRRMEQLNTSLLQHKTALSELRQSLNNSFKLDNAAATSMNALSQSLARMRMTYRELTEEERNSPFGQELLASIQQADAKIKQLDASIGNHQRNVGNYASGWNGLNMSIQQIGRELPSLAMGWNTFFLAISNNLPILSDELARARKEYNELKAAGQQATPVWKQVVSSLLSWQTALTVGITLLTLYGSEIIDWVGNLFKAKDGTVELEEATKRLNTAISGVYGNISEEMRSLKQLNESLQQTKRGTEEWNRIRNKIVTEYSKYLPSIDEEIEKTGKLASSYEKLSESIRKAAAARGFEELKSKENEKYAEILVNNYQKVYEKLIDIYGQESGQKIFDNWKNWAESSKEIPADVQKAFSSVSIGFSDTANSLLFKIRNQQKAREQTLDKFKQIFDLNDENAELLPSDSIKAIQDRISAQREALEKLSTSSKEYKDLLKSIQKDEQKLSLLTSKPQGVNKSAESIKDYLDELTKLREDNEDRQIELMQEGTDKEVAEIELRYKRIREKVQELEKNLYNSQGGKLTQEQSVMFNIAYTGIDNLQSRDVKSATEDAAKKRIDAEREAMNEYLKEYGTYQQKRLAITEEYQLKISEATTKGSRMTLQKQMEEELADLDAEAIKTTSAISELFGDMTDKTLKELERISTEGSAALEFLKSGRWDEEKGVSFGITKEQFDTISKSPEKLKAISDELNKNREATERLRPAYEKVADGLNKMFNAGNNSKKLKEALDDIQDGLNEVMQAAGFLSDTLSSLGDAFGSDALSGISEGINVAMGSLDSAMQGAQAASSLGLGGIGAAAGAAVGLVGSLASSIAKIHDKRNEKQIQRLQDQIDTLDSSYGKLGRSIEEAYSKDASGLIENQNKLLEQKKILIQQQIKEEEDKKKTDNDRIKEWKEQIEGINQTIEDNKEKAVDAIFGEDLQSAIENFSDAYAEAWTNGEDRAKSAKDTVKKMMQQMVSESIKAAIQSSGAMEEIRTKLKQFYADNVLSGWEQDYIYNMAEELQKELDSQFGWADSLFESDDAEKQQSASSKGFETMTQDQASELSGRFTAVAESNYRIEGSITQLSGPISAIETSTTGLYNIADETRSILASSYLELQQISENTGAIIVPIQKIQKDIEQVKQNTSRL